MSGERRTWFLSGIAALLGTGAALSVAELAFRLFLPQPLGLSYRAPSGITLNIPGAAVRYRRSEFDNRIEINSLGLRDREVMVPKPSGTFRILVLGDSFAEGKQVSLHETFPKRLEEALPERFPEAHWEVVNGGISGYGTADEIKFFELVGRGLDPDLVILAFCVGNDVENNVNSPYFRWDGERLEELPMTPIAIPRLWFVRMREFAASHFHFYQFLRDRYHRNGYAAVDPDAVPVQIVAPMDDRGWRLTEALLDRLLELVDRAGARLFLVAIPQRAQVFDDEWIASTGLEGGDPRRVEPQMRLTAYARRRLLPFLDLTYDLHGASIGARPYFRIDGHLNAFGHRVAADAILDSLVNFHRLGETR